MSESKDLQQYMDAPQEDVAEAFRIYRMRSLDDRVTVILIENVIKALQLNNVMDIEKEIQGLSEKIWIDEGILKPFQYMPQAKPQLQQ